MSYSTVPAEREIMIQDLLRHTSGFVYGVSESSELDRRYYEAGVLLEAEDLQETVERLADMPLLFHPGSRWNYGLSTDVLSRLVEVVSGKRFDKFLENRIFKPLGMDDTHFELPDSKNDRLAQLYTRESETKLIPSPEITRSYMGKPGYYSGGAGLLSTAADYWRFCQMLLNGGAFNGRRLLSPKSVELMSMDHLGAVPGGFTWAGGSGFGLGFQVILDPGAFGQVVSEGLYSWGGAAGTGFFIDQEEQLIGVFMIQIMPHSGLQYSAEYRNLVYQAIESSASYGAPVALQEAMQE
jgi:CubicO group peptidase (beta-lactamase class C family)